jgi:hypothetical protein
MNRRIVRFYDTTLFFFFLIWFYDTIGTERYESVSPSVDRFWVDSPISHTSRSVLCGFFLVESTLGLRYRERSIARIASSRQNCDIIQLRRPALPENRV